MFAPHFKGSSWESWKAFLAALFALPPPDGALETYAACTGRTAWPEKPFSEAVLICGRRAGKSVTLALTAVFLACFRDYRKFLAAGEVATIMVIAANRPQARSIFRYISGLLKAIPLVTSMVEDENTESIVLSNRVQIEIGTASFRVTRGYTYAAVLCDEIAFFRDETSANPDEEILRAIRPGMASIPGAMLLLASSPYAKRGSLYNAYRRHYGKDGARVLCWKAATTAMNPRVPAEIIADAYESDPQAADAEYGANFRSDLADYISREAVDEVMMHGRHELPPCDDVIYTAFADPSGGSNDSFTLAIAHRADDGVGVLDHLTEIRAPYDPEQAVATCAGVLKRYGVTRVAGDRYASEWPKSRFASAGISFEQNAMPKSDIYSNSSAREF